MQDPKSRTGRTFRALLRALEAASRGERVLFSAHSVEYARDLFHTSARVSDGYFLSVSNYTLLFEGGGRLRFIGPLRLRPVGYTLHFHDHFTGGNYAKNIGANS